MAVEHGVGDDEAWAGVLCAAKDTQPLVATLFDAVAPLAAIPLFAQHCGDMARVRTYVHSKRAAMRTALAAHGLGGYDEEHALTIHAYTTEADAAGLPLRLYDVVNSAMRSPTRGDGPGGISAELRACMPYIKLLWVALESLPPAFHFSGKTFRGVQWAFPTPMHHEPPQVGDHDPERYFFRGRNFSWYEFKSSAMIYSVMYEKDFCGDRGPRTVFIIEGVKCYRIKIFSAVQREEEALFLPLTRFQVQDAQKKLEPARGHLTICTCPGRQAGNHRAQCKPGGFPDEVHLVAPGFEQEVPRELKLKQVKSRCTKCLGGRAR